MYFKGLGCFVITLLLNYSNCVRVYCKTESNEDVYMNTSSIISEDQMKKEGLISTQAKGLSITKNNAEDKVDVVKDFTKLMYLTILTRQSAVPILENLPAIEAINMSGNNLIYIKRESFATLSLSKIYLGKNQISVIEDLSFGYSVRILELNCNNLTTFSPNWFLNVSSLERLSLVGNYLTTIEANLFLSMINLNEIYLADNDITSIGHQAFGNRNNFYWLTLDNNHLEELNANAFGSEKVKIRCIQINNNNLTYLSDDLLDKLSITESIILEGNPWQCPCWFKIKKWLPDAIFNSRDDDRPICVASLSFTNHCVPLTDKELIQHYHANVKKSGSKRDYCIIKW